MADGAQRIDKWLFFARVVKSRSLAQKLVGSSAVRINRDKIDNPARLVRAGDVLTITLRGGVRVLKVAHPGTRRGPASEATTLYEDLSDPGPASKESDGTKSRSNEAQSGTAPATAGAPAFQPGRAPTSRERRALEKLKRGEE